MQKLVDLFSQFSGLGGNTRETEQGRCEMLAEFLQTSPLFSDNSCKRYPNKFTTSSFFTFVSYEGRKFTNFPGINVAKRRETVQKNYPSNIFYARGTLVGSSKGWKGRRENWVVQESR